jgi:NRPS condensation-like uncharacterized protein
MKKFLSSFGTGQKWAVTSGDLNIYYARAVADQQITYVVELGDRLDLKRLESSVRELMKRVPVLKSNIKVDGVHVKRILSSNGKYRISFADQPYDPQKVILGFISAPCDPESEMPLKLLVVRSNVLDTLCIKIDHVVSDAGGLKYLLYLLADAYTNGEITLPINQDRSMRQVFHKFSVLQIIRKALQANMPKPGPALLRGPFVCNEPFIEHVKLKPDVFHRLYSKAKAANITINDLLLTAVYQAVFGYPAVQAGSAYPIMVPIDMRRYLKIDKRGVIANFSSSLYPTLNKIENESFTDTLRRVKSCMDTCKNNAPGLGTSVIMSVGTTFCSKRMKAMYEMASSHKSSYINLTNFGIIDEDLLRFDKTPVNHIYGVGPVENAPGLLIAVSTFQGTLNLVVQGDNKQRFQAFAKEFLEKILLKLTDYLEVRG